MGGERHSCKILPYWEESYGFVVCFDIWNTNHEYCFQDLKFRRSFLHIISCGVKSSVGSTDNSRSTEHCTGESSGLSMRVIKGLSMLSRKWRVANFEESPGFVSVSETEQFKVTTV